MAAEVETMMYVGETPWHGFGEYLPEDADSPEAQIKSGLTWEVEKRPLLVPVAGVNNYRQVENHVAIVRKTDERVLGVVGDGWQVLQPWEMFDWTDSLVREGQIKYHTAGSLRGGQKVWLLAKFDESVILPTDRVGKYLFFLNGYDGTQSIVINSTAVRVVCMNTTRLALRDGRANEIRIRHTASMMDRMEAARAALGIAREHGKVYDGLMRALTQLRMTGDRWNEYTNVLVPNNETAKNNTRAENARRKIIELAITGRGQDIPGVAGTGYAAYNAVTEFANYFRASRGGAEMQERRFESSLMGSGDEFIQAAVVQLDTYLKQDGIIVDAA